MSAILNPRPVPLKTLLDGLVQVPEALDRAIVGLSCDSRDVQPGVLFCALRGEQHHGLDFLPAVRAAGAAAVIWEPDYAGHLPAELVHDAACPLLTLPRLRQRLGQLADRFYADPSRQLELIGITGTDGKTSCAYFIAQCLSGAQTTPCALLGTLGYGLYGQLAPAALTTPDAIAIRQHLAAARQQGAVYGVMEVSSHALQQYRVTGLAFKVAVLTNLTRDHLDYHGSSEAYAAAKRQLFIAHQPHWTILNTDDDFGLSLAYQRPEHVISYSITSQPRVKTAYFVHGYDVQPGPDGLRLQIYSSWGDGLLHSGLLGRFNASNLLATLATLLALDIPFAEALQRVAAVTTAPGRMERFGGGPDQPLVVVDYAHTPHALGQTLQALREHVQGRLWCVFGCGGDRDPGKRPLMGAQAERWADHLVITNDNPRSEHPQRIVDDILSGLQHPQDAHVILDRAQAIIQTLATAGTRDSVLIAGKGHEDYQLLGQQRIAFSDRAVVQAQLEQVA